MESWWPLSAWLSPSAAMFLFFNVLVGAVAVMSRGQQGQQGEQGRRLCRSASSMVLGRLRSFSSVFSGHPAAEWYGDCRTPAEAGVMQAGEAPPEPVTAPPPSTPAVTAAPDTEPLMPASRMEEGEECTEQKVQGQQRQAPAEAEAEPSQPAASAAGEPTAIVKTAGKEQPPTKEAPVVGSSTQKTPPSDPINSGSYCSAGFSRP